MTLNDYLTFNLDIGPLDTVIIWDSAEDYEHENCNWCGWTVEEIPEKLRSRNIAGFSGPGIYRNYHVILA